MTNLILMRGYPGSGKTTWAREWVTSADLGPRARVSRDDLRDSLFSGKGVLTYAQEQHITDVQQDTVRKLLKRGYDVVVDDMNLRRRFAVDWAAIALEQQAGFQVWDVLTSVDECVDRDDERRANGGRHVGEANIRKIASRFPMSRWPSPDSILGGAKERQQTVAGAWDVYSWPHPDAGHRVWIVDIDGTVAKKAMGDGTRGWHEYDRVGEDVPNPPVIDLVNALADAGKTIMFVSGRKDSCREQTRRWLADHVGEWTEDCRLYMRESADNRSDDIVKYEIFNREFRWNYNVEGVLDDRNRVVAMWRAIGLQVYQVADGDF